MTKNIIFGVVSLVAAFGIVFAIFGTHEAKRMENLLYEQIEVTRYVTESAEAALDNNYDLASRKAREAEQLQREITEKL